MTSAMDSAEKGALVALRALRRQQLKDLEDISAISRRLMAASCVCEAHGESFAAREMRIAADSLLAVVRA